MTDRLTDGIIKQELAKHGVKPKKTKVTEASKQKRTVKQKEEIKQVEDQIVQLEKSRRTKKVVVELTEAEADQIQREADSLCLPFEDHFRKVIAESVFDKRIGAPIIKSPSKYASKITAPTGSVRRLDQ